MKNTQTERVLMSGNEAMAEAAIIAGCRFYAGYPITPQNEVPAYMAMRMPEVGGTFIQAESELAAINMVFGAAAAGARAMTSSSSPGISLKQEGISYIAAAHLPCVIANIVRGSPGLGNIGPAQSDYFQATKGGGHGDYHMIVLTPDSVQEMATLTVQAFDLADRYRTPVMILSDGLLGQMEEPLVLPVPVEEPLPPKPWALTGCKGRRPNVIRTLWLHPDEAVEENNRLLQEKYETIKKELWLWEGFQLEDAKVVLVSYGSSARLCRLAVDILRESGIKTGLFRLVTAWPFPYKALEDISNMIKGFLCVEMSTGQMVEDVRLAASGRCSVKFYGRTGGMIPRVKDIVNAARELSS